MHFLIVMRAVIDSKLIGKLNKLTTCYKLTVKRTYRLFYHGSPAVKNVGERFQK